MKRSNRATTLRRGLVLHSLLLILMACNMPPPLPPLTLPPTITSGLPPTPTPAPTATPTPLPADLLRDGEQAIFVGDTDSALLAFQAALSIAPDDETKAKATLGLGRAYLQDGAYSNAAAAFQDLLARFSTSSLAHDAHFLLAESLVGAGDAQSGADHYRAYLERKTDIEPYIQQWLGDALHAAGDDMEAIAAYQVGIETAPDLSFEVDLREKLASLYIAQEEYDAALAQYEAILDQATISSYRARIAYQAAQTLMQAGQTGEGYARHREVVETYGADPQTYPWPYESLVILVGAGMAVDDLTRGIVDYYGGAYDPAAAALYRYIETDPNHSGSAHYYVAMTHLRAGSPTLAEDQFRTLVETHPESDYWGDGWMGWAEALSAQGNLDGAVETYRAFAATAPDHPRAPEALWTAAQLLEGAGLLEEAGQVYEECQETFPTSEYAAASLLRGGLQRYRQGAMEQAAADWQVLAEDYPASGYQAAGFLWLGKAHLAAGHPLSATAAFSQAVRSDPLGYYGLRAADLLADPLAVPFPPIGYTPVPKDVGRSEAETWLADWLELPSTEGLGDLDPALKADPRLRRGLELWRLGRQEQAKAELEALREDTANDAKAQYQLALLFRDIGLYRSSILAAVKLIALSPAAGPLDAPPFLARLAYPTYYEELVLSNALSENLSPLLLFALIRQESLYEGFATSWASAHGLMQVIPSTGAYIADQLDWPPGYETADLHRPIVSLRFGTWYLARQRDAFDGRPDVALAAYNGGPGNASYWLTAAGGDPDLFLELITLGETRLYLQLIREHYAVYSALYATEP